MLIFYVGVVIVKLCAAIYLYFRILPFFFFYLEILRCNSANLGSAHLLASLSRINK